MHLGIFSRAGSFGEDGRVGVQSLRPDFGRIVTMVIRTQTAAIAAMTAATSVRNAAAGTPAARTKTPAICTMVSSR